MNKFFKYADVNFEYCQDQFDRKSTPQIVVVLKDMPMFAQYAKMLGDGSINVIAQAHEPGVD